MQIRTLKNRKTLLIITVAVLGLFGARWIGTNSLMAQDGHEHTEKTSDHNDHADHDEDSGHEGHGEEAANMQTRTSMMSVTSMRSMVNIKTWSCSRLPI